MKKPLFVLFAVILLCSVMCVGFQAGAYGQAVKPDGGRKSASENDPQTVADRLERLEAEVVALRAALNAQNDIRSGSLIQHSQAVGKAKPSSKPAQGKGTASEKKKGTTPAAPPDATSLGKNPDANRYRWDGKRWWFLDEFQEWLYWNGTAWAPAVKASTSQTTVERSGPGKRSGLVADMLIDPQSGDVLGYTHHFEYGTDRVGENN